MRYVRYELGCEVRVKLTTGETVRGRLAKEEGVSRGAFIDGVLWLVPDSTYDQRRAGFEPYVTAIPESTIRSIQFPDLETVEGK